MKKTSLFSFGEKGTKLTFFLFFGLIILSSAFFVFAENNSSANTIFDDSDQDGLSNDEEKLYGTDPMKKDSDSDGYGDAVEVESGYDPLKPAPGDKIIKEGAVVAPTTNAALADSESLTEKVSSEIVGMLQNTDKNGETISMEDINTSVDKVLSGNMEEIVFPEINTEDIKIKKISKKLSDKKQLEQEKKDALEYLTVLSYLIANNSPKTFQTTNDFGTMLNNLSIESVAGIASGNTKSLDDLSKQGEKMLVEFKDIEVPEKMLDIHVKALQMAQYAIQLKKELKPNDSDPLGQIAVLSRAQGFFSSVIDLVTTIKERLTGYGITEIPFSS